MKKFLISFALSAFAFAAIADNWGDASAWVYKPKYPDYEAFQYVEWIVTDSRGNSASIYYENNADGTVDTDSLKDAMDTLKLSVSSIFQNMAYLAQDVVSLNYTLIELDQELQDLDKKLDNVFGTVFGKMKEIETKMGTPTDSGGTTPTTIERTIIEKTEEKIVIAGGVAALKVDGKTIGVKNEGTANAAYQIKGYPELNGWIPFSTRYTGLIWNQPKTWFDGSSINVDVDSLDRPSVGNNKHGVHLAGWYTPEASPYHCNQTLAEILQDEDSPTDTHYALTRFGENGQMHYTKIGRLIGSGGGYALKVIGTTSSNYRFIGAPSSKTNTVTFVSASDSNVAVTIGGNNDAVTVTIGVYYK